MRSTILLLAAALCTGSVLLADSNKFDKTIAFPRGGEVTLDWSFEKCTIKSVKVVDYPADFEVDKARREDPNDKSNIGWQFFIDNRSSTKYAVHCPSRCWTKAARSSRRPTRIRPWAPMRRTTRRSRPGCGPSKPPTPRRCACVQRSSPSNSASGAGASGATGILTPPDYTAALAGRAHRLRGQGVLGVEGPDRSEFLQGQLTQDVRTLGLGQSRPAAGLTPKGKLIYLGPGLQRGRPAPPAGPGGRRVRGLGAPLKYAVFQKVIIRDETEECAVLGVYGRGRPAIVLATPPGEARVLPPEGEFAVELLGPRPVLETLARELRERRIARGLRRDRRDPAGRGRATPLGQGRRRVESPRRGRPRRRDLDDEGMLRRSGGRRAPAHVRPRQPPADGIPLPAGAGAGGNGLPQPREAGPRARSGHQRRLLPALRRDRAGPRLPRDRGRARRLAAPGDAERVALVARLPFALASASPSALS